MINMTALEKYLIRLGDDSLILGQRLSEWCGHGPILEEDIAMTNVSLDLLGQATLLFEYAASLNKNSQSADDLAFLRFENQYSNVLLVEQDNGDFGKTMVRQFLFDAFRKPLYELLCHSGDTRLREIAEKSLKETRYHLKHSSEWVIRLGDGTEESHQRVQEAVNDLWRYTSELFYEDEVDNELKASGVLPDLTELKKRWQSTVEDVLGEATLSIPENNWQFDGGRRGVHTESMGYILADLQYMQRAYPGLQW